MKEMSQGIYSVLRHMYANKLDKRVVRGQIPRNTKSTKAESRTEYKNRPRTSKKTESVIKNLLTKKSSESDGFTSNQTFKEHQSLSNSSHN